MFGLIVEARRNKGFVKLDRTSVNIPHDGVYRIPPLGINGHVAQRPREQRISLSMEIKSTIELRCPTQMLDLQAGKRVDPRPPDPSESIDSFRRSEPVESQKSLVRTDAQQASPTTACTS